MNKDLFSLAGKVALITGGGRGIGRYIAAGLANAGADLILTSRTIETLKTAAEELTEEFGKDLWEKCLEKKRGKGTTEDMYWWYKKQCKMGQTPSELAIALGRTTTKGLR